MCVSVHTHVPMLAHVDTWNVSLCMLCVLTELVNVFPVLCVRQQRLGPNAGEQERHGRARCSSALRTHVRSQSLSCSSGERNEWGKWGNAKVHETRKLKTPCIPT